MNEFRMRSDGKIVTEQEYRLNNPNKMFPAILVPDDADPILKSPPPTVVNTHAVRDGVEQDALGNWVEKWKSIPLTVEEIANLNKKPVPQFVAMWQARDVLIKHNLINDVIGFINAIQDPVERMRAQSKFEFSNTVQRNDPLVNYVVTKAGYSQSQIDDLFIEAEGL